MKKTLKERIDSARRAFFAAEDDVSPGRLVVTDGNFALQNQEEEVSKKAIGWWTFAKYFLFFLPGVSILFFVTLAMTYFLVFQNEGIRNFSFAFFWLILGTFMTMFGIGKLSDLKYLKVIGAVMLITFVLALSFFFVPDDLKGKFFGSYSLYFLPFVALVGAATKKWIDRADNELS